MLKVCANLACNTEFLAHENASYCSDRCKQKAYRERRKNRDSTRRVTGELPQIEPTQMRRTSLDRQVEHSVDRLGETARHIHEILNPRPSAIPPEFADFDLTIMALILMRPIDETPFSEGEIQALRNYQDKATAG